MENQKRMQQSERNPKTHARHRREVFWQIILPLVVGILLLLAALAVIILSATQPVTELGRWADVSPSLFFAFILLVILVGLVYVVSIILRAVPQYTYKIQHFLERVTGIITRFTDLMAEPVLRIHTFVAVVHRLSKFFQKETPQKQLLE
jgi:hypothetical protein